MASRRARTYWLCQLIGWGTYGLAIFVLYSFGDVPKLRMALHSVVYCSAAVGLTHALRAFIHRRRWSELGFVKLGGRIVFTSLLLAVVLDGVVFVSSLWLFHLRSGHDFSWIGAAFLLLSFWFVFACWELIYFAVHALERARNAERDRWQLVAAAKDAELRFLRGQMHPHFLFNCLNSLRALISEDPTRAQTMVTQLAAILRHSLSAEASPTVPLERELAVVRDYLALEGVRLEQRLKVKLDIAPESLTAPVPPMLVQTLVENGIKHGVARIPAGGEIQVTARVDHSELDLRVVSPIARPAESAPGVGLANARERLRLLFGDRASISLDAPESASAATAHVRIPIPS